MHFKFYLLETNVGPFAPVVGYIGAALAAVYSIWILVWGRKGIWETPQNFIPQKGKNLLRILLVIGMVLIWLNTNPSNISDIMKAAIWMGSIAVLCFLLYFYLIPALSYEKEIAKSSKKTERVKILGGLWLTNEAKNIKKKRKLSVQELFAGSAYNEDKLWSRLSQGSAKSLIILLFLIIITCGTLGLTAAGFVIQVKLTGKPAAGVIKKDDAPGINSRNK